MSLVAFCSLSSRLTPHSRGSPSTAAVRRPVVVRRNKLLSTTTEKPAEKVDNVVQEKEAVVDHIIEGSNTENLGRVIRHGRGDAPISLNIGGKEYLTLRSTVNSNPVLADHVARALRNGETTKNGAIFIDRDSAHFGFILQYLRNRMEMLSYTSKSTASFPSLSLQKKFTETYVELPEDPKILRDLYIESSYYRIPELQEALTRTGWVVRVMDLFTNTGNPFDTAAKWVSRIRNFAVAFATFGTLGTTVLIAIKHDFDEFADNLGQKIGIKKKRREEPDESGILYSVGLLKKEEKDRQPGLEEVLKEAAKALEKK